MRRVALIAALALLGAPVAAHADVDAWTKEHGRQFEARWHNHAGGAQWQKEMVQFCKEGAMHDHDIGVFDADYTLRAMDRCNGWATTK
jgi:hypothetical protein